MLITKDFKCKCNNCESILIDENPQVDAIEKLIEIGDKYMIKINGVWACPECETDEYLIDL